jgi:hypothetical protein
MWIFPEMGEAVKNVHFSLVGKKKMLEHGYRDLGGYYKMPMILYRLRTLITLISGICWFQSGGTVSKIKRKSRVWPGSIGAAETGWVST